MNIHEASRVIVTKLEQDLYNRGLLDSFSLEEIITMRKTWLLLVLHTLEDAKRGKL